MPQGPRDYFTPDENRSLSGLETIVVMACVLIAIFLVADLIFVGMIHRAVYDWIAGLSRTIPDYVRHYLHG